MKLSFKQLILLICENRVNFYKIFFRYWLIYKRICIIFLLNKNVWVDIKKSYIYFFVCTRGTRMRDTTRVLLLTLICLLWIPTCLLLTILTLLLKCIHMTHTLLSPCLSMTTHLMTICQAIPICIIILCRIAQICLFCPAILICLDPWIILMSGIQIGGMDLVSPKVIIL